MDGFNLLVKSNQISSEIYVQQTLWGIAMARTRYRGAWTYSRSRTPSAIHRARRLVTTSLASLGTVLLFGLASHGPAVIDAVSSVG